jgi:S1-C subfamily serine protease
MYRAVLACGLLALLAALVPAADKPTPEEILAAFQGATTAAVERASPSVVCILVSRSDGYKQLGAGPGAAAPPGRLGGFDGARLRKEAQDRHDRTREALVNRLDLANPQHIPESFGSGIVIGEAGLILTPYHVVRDATKVYVRLPGARDDSGSYADIHAADPRSDLAVLKLLTPPPGGLKALPLGRGEDARRGQFVLALTNSFAAGFRDDGPGADYGMISKLSCRQEGPAAADVPDGDRGRKLYNYQGSLIQTTARLNAACSGGALLNLKGELIGITSSLAEVSGSDAPGGFAVPMNVAMRRIVARLKEGKEVEYGFLGVTFPQVPDRDGVRIGGVTPGSPAEQARLPVGQYLVKIDGQPIKTNDDLFLAIGAALAGSTIRLELAANSNGPTREFRVELAKYYVPGPFIASERPPAVGGLRVDYASTIIKSSEAQRPIPRGVVVREVLRNSPAERANVQVDRVITRVNGRPVATPAAYYEEVRRGTGPLELTFSNDETVKLERR